MCLGVGDEVVFRRPHSKRLDVIARAKVMLYPSRVDGFPYAVLGAHHLEPPVAVYDIPALRLYHS